MGGVEKRNRTAGAVVANHDGFATVVIAL